MLSKSKIKQGIQCELALYNSVYHKFLAQYSKDSLASFKRGNNVGEWARTFFSDGVLISGVRKEDKISRTNKALPLKKPLFEASFDFRDILVQVDILVPEEISWKVVEVKSGTSVKEDYLLDLAIQYYVLKNQKNLSFSNFSFWIVNKEAKVKDQSFFKEEDVTTQVQELCLKIEPIIDKLISMVKTKTKPQVQVGSHCFYPYECAFLQSCWQNVPTHKTVLVLPEEMKNKFLKDKKLYLKDTDLDPLIIKSLEEKKIFFDREKIKEKLQAEDPTFLRIYTRMNTYPEGDFTPYSRIPWGFSLKKGDKTEEVILSSSSLEKFWEALEPHLEGSVVVFDKFYEIYKLLDTHPHPEKAQEILNKLSNLVSASKYHLFFPEVNSYDLNSWGILMGKPTLVSVEASASEDLKEEKDILIKIEKTKVLRDHMKAEILRLEEIYKFIKS